jgi:hypothetical protein
MDSPGALGEGRTRFVIKPSSLIYRDTLYVTKSGWSTSRRRSDHLHLNAGSSGLDSVNHWDMAMQTRRPISALHSIYLVSIQPVNQLHRGISDRIILNLLAVSVVVAHRLAPPRAAGKV